MPIVIPNHAQVTMLGTFLGQPWANVFCVNKGSATLLDETTAGAIATDFGDAYNGYLNDVLSNDCALANIRVMDLQSSTAPSFLFNRSIAGLLTGENCPPDQSLVTTWTTGLRGQRYRGRTYLAGWTEGNNEDNGRPGSGTVVAVQNWANDLLTRLSSSGTDLALAHPDLGSATPILSYTVRTVWRRQRRRTYTV